jgi:DNA-binding MarR family transcriptional regulator
LTKRSASRRREASPQPFDRAIVYRLLRLVNLIAKPFFAHYGRKYDLSLHEWRVMMLLANRPGLSASEICEQTGMHLMNVSRGVRRLARLGRLARRIDPADRRRAALALTARGLALYRRIAPDAWQRESTVHAVLTRGELAEFGRLLDKLLAGFLAQGNDGKP